MEPASMGTYLISQRANGLCGLMQSLDPTAYRSIGLMLKRSITSQVDGKHQTTNPFILCAILLKVQMRLVWENALVRTACWSC